VTVLEMVRPRAAADERDLPAPVARYLDRSLRGRVEAITRVDLAQTGEILLGKRWFPFQATQQFTTSPPGFVWDARVRLFPLVYATVRDSYVRGAASMRARAAGIVPLVNQSGKPELAAAELQRYLGEAVWFPTALRPGSNLTWTPLDGRRAIASLRDGHTRVSLEFRFTEAGDVEEVFATDRFAEVGGRYERRPWLVRCDGHRELNGIRIPTWCEVEWQLPTGPLAYWRGRVADIRYSFERR
jgi:hypothetical protein